MKHFRFTTLFVALLFHFNALPVEAQLDPSSEAFKTSLDSIFADNSELSMPGAGVIIMKGNKTILTKNYGAANLAFEAPFTEQTIFPMNGFGNQLLAFSILQLEQKGKLSLTDPVNKHLPELNFNNQVKISHIINQSSGLPIVGSLRLMAGWNFSDPIYSEEFLNILKHFTSDLEPDQENQHNGSGDKILQLLVEKISEKDFPSYASANIFEPLGMTNSMVKGGGYQENKNHSTGYDPRDFGFQIHYSTEYEGGGPWCTLLKVILKSGC